jgi:hypothetical protein
MLYPGVTQCLLEVGSLGSSSLFTVEMEIALPVEVVELVALSSEATRPSTTTSRIDTTAAVNREDALFLE